jgi:hypothetical protein
MNNGVYALAVLPNGDLIAGGGFTTAGGTGANYIAIVSPEGLVGISAQPADVSLVPGGLATFRVQAAGSGLSHRWRRNGVDLFDDARHVGTATPTFTLSGVSNADQGFYTCMITNVCETRESRAAELSCRPIIAAEPPEQVVLRASGATVRVDMPPNVSNRYRWRQKGQNLFNIPGLIRGATTPVLELLSNDPSLLGAYDLVITNDCGRTTSNLVFVVEDSGANGCIGDHNRDGGVDGGDVEAFFIDWQDGLFEADVNQDGGVDGGDIQTFFVAWQAGC